MVEHACPNYGFPPAGSQHLQLKVGSLFYALNSEAC